MGCSKTRVSHQRSFSAMLSPDSVCRGVVKPCRSRRSKSKNILIKQCLGTMLPLTVASLYLGRLHGLARSSRSHSERSLDCSESQAVAACRTDRARHRRKEGLAGERTGESPSRYGIVFATRFFAQNTCGTKHA